MNTLEQRHYVATETDIAQLADQATDGLEMVESAPLNYLRCLVGTSKDKLKMPLGARRGKPAQLTEKDIDAQLAAVDEVHNRFYSVLTARFAARIPRGKEHATTVNKRTNRYRTVVYALRLWVKGGKDLAALNPDTVTKASLRVDSNARKRATSVTVLRKRVVADSTTFMSSVLALAESDKGAAVTELKLLVGQLAQQLNELTGDKPLHDIRQAAEQRKPFREKGSSILYIPTDTQVIRAQANPS